MSRITSIILVLLTAISFDCQAQTIIERITSFGNIRIYQSENLYRLIEPVAAVDSLVAIAAEPGEDADDDNSATRTGYRVLVFDDNNPRTARSQAESRHSQMQAEFPYMRAYVTFNSPYWRVKVGDFRTRGEAEAAMAEMRHKFPALAAYMRVVRDKINEFD